MRKEYQVFFLVCTPFVVRSFLPTNPKKKKKKNAQEMLKYSRSVHRLLYVSLYVYYVQPFLTANFSPLFFFFFLLLLLLLSIGSDGLQLPQRTETVRNDQTSAARGEPFTLAVRERLRRKHASLSEKVFLAPAVAVV